MPLRNARHFACGLLAAGLFCSPTAPAAALRFDFGSGAAAEGWVPVTPDTVNTRERGFGFEPGVKLTAIDRGRPDAIRGDFITSERPFLFTARVPSEGNYRVTVTLGDAAGESVTTIKAELRRLMVEKAATPRGAFATVSFIVNTRTPQIAAVDGIPAGAVRLKAPRETTQEAWAWDDAITLEFSNSRPAVCGVEIEPADVPTIFLLGDSTVCDQSKEPYSSWGQMFPRWFKPVVAVANHGESGETYRDSIGRRRLDKILSVMRPGDWLIMQFGHNDQKQIAAKSGGPFTTYPVEIKRHVEGVRRRGGTPVIVSPMERRGFDPDGRVRASLGEYAESARRTAQELGVAFLDLNALSKTLYQAWGEEGSARAFAAPDGKIDNTHHNNFGSYELAKCLVQALRRQQLLVARWITDDFRGFDPARPDDPHSFAVPSSGEFTNQRPLGDETNSPRSGSAAAAVPSDFEVRWGSGATHAEWGREEGTLNARGELVWLKTQGFGPGEKREESRGRATPEQMADLWRTIQENRFFDLKEHYSNPSIHDGFSSYIMVTAEGRRHSSAVMNTSQERFTRVEMALDGLRRAVLASEKSSGRP